jgi:hypothetical protein
LYYANTEYETPLSGALAMRTNQGANSEADSARGCTPISLRG